MLSFTCTVVFQNFRKSQNGDAGLLLADRHRVMSYYKPVSRILFPGDAGMVIIYLCRQLPGASICLPINVNPAKRDYRASSPQR